MSLFSTLSDPFTATVLNLTLWAQTLAGSMVATFVSSGASLDFPASTTSSCYASILSNRSYDLTGVAVSVQIIATPTSASGVDTSMWVYTGSTTTNAARFVLEAGTLYAQYWSGGVKNTPNSIAFNATTMAYWRIRTSGGTMFWDYSSDGGSWTNLTSVANPFTVTSLLFMMEALSNGTASSPGSFKWKGLNPGAIVNSGAGFLGMMGV